MAGDTKIKNGQNCWPSTADASGHQSKSSQAIISENQHTEHCMVCSSSLTYLEQAIEVTCSYCGKIEHGHISCPEGHYVCDACHNRDAMKLIEDIALTTKSRDPFEISDLMMSFQGLPMLGCQHAYIAAGAFMAAIKNEGSRGITNTDIQEVFHRTQKQAYGGYCGLTGVCGIAPAIGACFAVLTGSKCGTDREQRITMEAVTRITRAITDLTGPSCCKAYVWTSLTAAVHYLNENIGIVLPSSQSIICTYSGKHPHGCREEQCPYFSGLGNSVKPAPLMEKNCSKVSEAGSLEGGNSVTAMTALSSGPEGAAWPSGEPETQGESQTGDQKKMRVRPLMEACGTDVFKTARANGFEIDTKRETYGRWNYFALVLIEWSSGLRRSGVLYGEESVVI